MDRGMARYLCGSGSMRKASEMIRIALAGGLAIGIGLGGDAMAQTLRFPPAPAATRAWLVDHNDKHEHGKNKHKEKDDEGDDEDRGRGRRSSVPGAWRDYPATPTYYYPPATYYPPPASYYPPPASSYVTPYAP